MRNRISYEPRMIAIAKKLRRNMTYSERVLWNRLKNFQCLGYDFHRQKPVLRYVVDFFCTELMLAIEVDGITHFDDGEEALVRQQSIEALGVHFIRVDALEVVKDSSPVIASIQEWILNYEEQFGIPDDVLARRSAM